jgi:hypothetical protein
MYSPSPGIPNEVERFDVDEAKRHDRAVGEHSTSIDEIGRPEGAGGVLPTTRSPAKVMIAT